MIKGAWYVCFDGHLKPQVNKCNIFSFGIRNDPSFDEAINTDYGCNVYSFDPYYEDISFTKIRQSNLPKLENSYIINVNAKWTFYRIGISGTVDYSYLNDLKIRGLLKFDQILELTKSKHQVIDIFKMDIEGAERGVLENLDIDYFCKYVKQFLLETHVSIKQVAVELLMKLEKCFFLFHRNTRFFFHMLKDKHGAVITEFENPGGYLLQLKHFKDEIELANYMLTMGELYFVNLNFL